LSPRIETSEMATCCRGPRSDSWSSPPATSPTLRCCRCSRRISTRSSPRSKRPTSSSSSPALWSCTGAARTALLADLWPNLVLSRTPDGAAGPPASSDSARFPLPRILPLVPSGDRLSGRPNGYRAALSIGGRMARRGRGAPASALPGRACAGVAGQGCGRAQRGFAERRAHAGEGSRSALGRHDHGCAPRHGRRRPACQVLGCRAAGPAGELSFRSQPGQARAGGSLVTAGGSEADLVPGTVATGCGGRCLGAGQIG
jgi:hypothetical protein